jgi:5-methylcytosine-specific restriction endonuclease McrA
MSSRHIPFYTFDKQNENGFYYCRQCGKLLTDKRKRYCSAKCQDEFFKNHSWDVLRTKILRENRICVECHIFWSQDVHHIIPYAERPDLLFDEENLQALCKICHKGKRPATQPKFRNLKRIKRNCHITIKLNDIKHHLPFLQKKFKYILVINCVIYNTDEKTNDDVFVPQLGRWVLKRLQDTKIWKVRSILEKKIQECQVNDISKYMQVILKNYCHQCPDCQVYPTQKKRAKGPLDRFLSIKGAEKKE